MEKKVQYLALAATALLISSCSSDILENGEGNTNNNETKTVTAVQEQLIEEDTDGKASAPSRTVVDPSTNKVTWSVGDAINIFDGERNCKFAATEVGSTVKFTAQNYGVRDNATKFMALYPYDIAATYAPNENGGTIKNVTVPAYQNAVANSYDPNSAVMAAQSTSMSETLQFKHLCAFVKFKTTLDCSRVVIRTKDLAMAGTCNIYFNGDGVPTQVQNSQTATSDSVVVVGDIKAGTYYYVAVLPRITPDGGVDAKSALSITLDPKPSKDMVDTQKKTINVAARTRQADTAPNFGHAVVKNFGTLSENNTKLDATFTIPYEDMGIGDDIKTAEHGHTVLWAKINLGASSETQIGEYYAWGETKPEADYSKKTYLCNDYYPLSLDAAHDAATVNWGHGWRMPTSKDFVALKSKSIFVYSEAAKGFYVYRGNGDITNYQKMSNGIYRYEDVAGVAKRHAVAEESATAVSNYINALTPETADHLFIPFGGNKSGTGAANCDAARYWMNDHGDGNVYAINEKNELTAYYWGLNSNEAFNTWSCWVPRYMGLTIRPVFEITW